MIARTPARPMDSGKAGLVSSAGTDAGVGGWTPAMPAMHQCMDHLLCVIVRVMPSQGMMLQTLRSEMRQVYGMTEATAMPAVGSTGTPLGRA